MKASLMDIGSISTQSLAERDREILASSSLSTSHSCHTQVEDMVTDQQQAAAAAAGGPSSNNTVSMKVKGTGNYSYCVCIFEGFSLSLYFY